MVSNLSNMQAPKKWRGWRGFRPPNNLPEFVDFISEKGCQSQGHRNEDSSSYAFKKATRIQGHRERGQAPGQLFDTDTRSAKLGKFPIHILRWRNKGKLSGGKK